MDTRLDDDEPTDFPIRRLRPETATALRKIITGIGLAAYCPLKPCKRAGGCATNHVLCWQVNRDDLTPIIMRLLARNRPSDGPASGVVSPSRATFGRVRNRE